MRTFTIAALVLSSISVTTAIGQEANKKKAKEAAAIRDLLEIQTDIEYAKDGAHSMKLDVYRPKVKGSEPRPCIVWIHGGGWQNGDKASGLARLGKWVATGDYVGVSVGYRLTDKGSWPVQIHDCKAAIRYLKAHAADLGIQPDHIGVWGGSAGGHLVSLLGTSGDVAELEGSLGVTGVSSRVACVVDYCGPSDFLRFAKDSPKLNEPGEPVYKLLGGSVQDKSDLAKQASPVTYVSKDDPPFLIVHGTVDALVPIDQANSFHEAQIKAGMKSEYIKMDGGGHGIGGEEIEKRVKAFFDRELLGRQTTVDTTAIVVAQ